MYSHDWSNSQFATLKFDWLYSQLTLKRLIPPVIVMELNVKIDSLFQWMAEFSKLQSDSCDPTPTFVYKEWQNNFRINYKSNDCIKRCQYPRDLFDVPTITLLVIWTAAQWYITLISKVDIPWNYFTLVSSILKIKTEIKLTNIIFQVEILFSIKDCRF